MALRALLRSVLDLGDSLLRLLGGRLGGLLCDLLAVLERLFARGASLILDLIGYGTQAFVLDLRARYQRPGEEPDPACESPIACCSSRS